MDFYPRSVLRLVVLSHVLVALPLLAAIGWVSWNLNDLAQQSEAVLRQAALAESMGHALPEDLNHMERSLRQHASLRDPSLLEDYHRARAAWLENSAQYASVPLLGQLAARVDAMRAAEAAAFSRLGAQAEDRDHVLSVIVDLKRSVRSLQGDANRLVATERDAFRFRINALRQQLLVAQVIALAAAGVLLWFGRRVTAQLWSRFERAVHALGQGQLQRRIRLKGPEDMRRVGRRLEWLRRRLMALEEQRTLVFRHVSHELKTPLATLREGSSLLQEEAAGPLTAAQKKIAGIMHGNALRLQALIESLLKLQQAGFVRERLEAVPVHLDELVQQVLATHQVTTRNKHLHVSGTLAPLVVEGGHEELLTIVDNLVSNAIKYSPDGGTVQISTSQVGEQAMVDVVDNGFGIPPVDRNRIFEPFYRSRSARGVAGTGLGLAIAHQFALAHRGSLELLESGGGAHFRVTLPLKWIDHG